MCAQQSGLNYFFCTANIMGNGTFRYVPSCNVLSELCRRDRKAFAERLANAALAPDALCGLLESNCA